MQIGYARISTDDQKMDLQMDALQRCGCDKIYQDTASGADIVRNGLDSAMKFTRPGDTLVVWKLDQLGRSLKHLIDVVNDLNKRGVFFKSVQENIDTSSSGGKLTYISLALWPSLNGTSFGRERWQDFRLHEHADASEVSPGSWMIRKLPLPAN